MARRKKDEGFSIIKLFGELIFVAGIVLFKFVAAYWQVICFVLACIVVLTIIIKVILNSKQQNNSHNNYNSYTQYNDYEEEPDYEYSNYVDYESENLNYINTGSYETIEKTSEQYKPQKINNKTNNVIKKKTKQVRRIDW